GWRRDLDPERTAVERPVEIGKWEPENYGGRFRGQMTLRSAFAHSINSVAVQVADAIGIQAVIDTAHKLGVQSELPAVPSLALGAGEVTLLEMTRAFAAIAADAESVEPYAVRAVRNGDRVLFTRQKSQLQPAGNPAARAAIHDLLASVVREGTGRAARINGPVEGKTGTSQNHKDAWFIGFTNDIVVGVWIGSDDNTPTRGVTGGDLPARIWNEFVTQSAAARVKSVRAKRGSQGCPPPQPLTPSQQRVRPSFAACRLCKIPGCWRLMDAWSGCLASKAPAAAPRATSSATSEVERWHANPPLAAATTDVPLMIKASRAWWCSMAAAERRRMRRRNCGRSSSRRARRAWASGAEGMMMRIELLRRYSAFFTQIPAPARHPRATCDCLAQRRIVN